MKHELESLTIDIKQVVSEVYACQDVRIINLAMLHNAFLCHLALICPNALHFEAGRKSPGTP